MPTTLKVTLHHVAAHAKVSIATVSRALNGLPVGVENLERVRKAADELGYVANEAARSLRSDRTMTIGMLFANITGSLELELLDSLSSVIADAGYSLMVATAQEDPARYDLLMRRFLERRVDALVCVRPQASGETLARCIAAGVPVVAMGGRPDGFPDLPLVYPSIQQGAAESIAHLKAFGHRRVALLTGGDNRGVTANLITQLKANGLSATVLAMPDIIDLPDRLKAWLAVPQAPTAIIASHREAVMLMMACDDLGIAVPADLSLVALMNHVAESFPTRRPFTAITPEPERLGRAAGETVLRWLQGKPPPKDQQVETGVFIVRATTALAKDE